jgi:hypothetical protein
MPAYVELAIITTAAENNIILGLVLSSYCSWKEVDAEVSNWV